MKLKDIRAQEEMVGFIIIIVIVAIIGVIFLSLSLRKSSSQVSSAELNSFLYSGLKVTSSCYNLEPLSFKELVTACQDNKLCDDGPRACDVLANATGGIIERAFVTGPDSKYKGYKLRISQGNSSLINLEKGAKGNSVAGEVPIYGLGGNSYIKLELYY